MCHPNTFSGQFIEVWRFNNGAAITAQIVPSMTVRNNQQNIRTRRHILCFEQKWQQNYGPKKMPEE
jgi:hypothetical protein